MSDDLRREYEHLKKEIVDGLVKLGNERAIHRGTLQQLAEVTAERDALKQALDESTVACEALRKLADDTTRENEALDGEFRVLKRRVEELEAACPWRDCPHGAECVHASKPPRAAHGG